MLQGSERVRERVNEGGRGRERERESLRIQVDPNFRSRDVEV